MSMETKFYELLKKAKNDEVSLFLVLNTIMPLITKYSLDKNKKIDDDLRSTLIEYAINIIKTDNFADKLAKNKKS